MFGAVRLLGQRLAVGLAFVLPLVFALGASTLRVYPFADRMLLFAVPSILIVIGQGIAAVANLMRRNRYAYGATWLVLALLLLFGPLESAIKTVRQPFGGEQVRPALEYLAAHRGPDDTVYVYYATYPTWRYYAPLIGLNVPGKIVEGRPSRREPGKYKEGIDALPREGKLWLIFSHVHTGSLGDEERLILGYVEEKGQVVDVRRFSQTTLYQVSLGAGPSGTAK